MDVGRHCNNDWPAAVQTVLRETGRDDVQVFAHCVGSTTFFMAMMAGVLKNVRSAVVSQTGPYQVVGPIGKAKAGLHLPALLDAVGVDSLTAYTDSESNWLGKLYDKALNLQHFDVEEQCHSSTCHRISFMYSLLYEHDQLNRATHDNLHELFGVLSVKAFDQLGLCARKEHVIRADGEDVYMPHWDRLNIPITFIHGEENVCYLPETTERSYNALVEKNGPAGYARQVIPNYGHIDCIFGKNAVEDVYPHILSALTE